jgi:hypothetical protein
MPFLRETLSVQESTHLIREWIEKREARFLRKLEKMVFKYPASPYLNLLQAAGCELGDVRQLLQTEGLDGTLERIRDAGVYVSWEELKGRKEVRRGSWAATFQEEEFNNPIIAPHYMSTSSGTSGVPVRIPIDLEDHTQSAPDWAFLFHMHGWMNEPLLFWTPAHTSMANRYLRCAKFGKRFTQWFLLAGIPSFSGRLRSEAVHRAIRLLGGFPKAVPGSVHELDKVADCLWELLSRGSKPVVNTAPSAAAALSAFVLKLGKSLAGVSFILGAEPVTGARRRTIEASGALAVPTYGTTEAGWVGAQFPGDTGVDDVRIFRDAYAVIDRTEKSQADPPPLLFTNLRPAGPKLLINAELGDSGVLERVTNKDEATEIGYDLRLYNIRSFRKVTAWGVTLALTDLYVVIEEDLPRAFEAGVGDFQLIEGQDERGISGLVLNVKPSVAASDHQVREVFRRELSSKRLYYRAMAGFLEEAGALRIERRDPIATRAGKTLPVVLKRYDQ